MPLSPADHQQIDTLLDAIDKLEDIVFSVEANSAGFVVKLKNQPLVVFPSQALADSYVSDLNTAVTPISATRIDLAKNAILAIVNAI